MKLPKSCTNTPKRPFLVVYLQSSHIPLQSRIVPLGPPPKMICTYPNYYQLDVKDLSNIKA